MKGYVKFMTALPLGVAALGLACSGAYLGAYDWSRDNLGSDVGILGTTEEIMEIRPHAPGSPGWLIERHGCWTGEAPDDMQGKTPGHAVVTVEGEWVATYTADPVLIHEALSEAVGGDDSPMIDSVHGFCR